MTRMSIVASLVPTILLAFLSFLGVHGQECPPPGLDTVASFDFASFISSPFFVLRAVPGISVAPNAFFCGRQAYSLAEEQSPIRICQFLPFLCIPTFPGQTFVDVLNSGNIGSVDGPLLSGPILAVTADPDGAAEAKVGASFLPSRTYTDLLVVAAGTFDDLLDESVTVAELADQPASTVYDWVIITSGPAIRSTGNGCIPRLEGLILYSRDPLPPPQIADRITEVADFLGFDTSLLEDFVQEGCTYPEFP